MALRNYKSYTYYDESGNVFNSLIADDIKGMYISDVQLLNSAPINRRLCCCGNVDAPSMDDRNTPCPKCGNTSFTIPSGHRYYWDRKNPKRVFNINKFFIDNDEIFHRTYNVEFSTTSKTIRVIQSQASCISVRPLNGVPEYLNYNFPDNISREKILEQVLNLMKSNSIMQRVVCLCENNKGDDKNAVLNGHSPWDVLSMYNMMTIAPFTQSLEYDDVMMIKKTWFESLYKTDIKMYYSLAEVEAKAKASVVMRDLIPVVGIIPNSKHLDRLNDGMIAALKYAIMHGYVNRKEICELFNMDSSVDKINDWGPDFTDFFRKNIMLYGTKIVKTYEHLLMTGASNMKEDSLIRLESYLEKKKFKSNQISKFEEEFLNGDPIAAMKALVS